MTIKKKVIRKIIEKLLEEELSEKKLKKIFREVSKKHKLERIPTKIQVLEHCTLGEKQKLKISSILLSLIFLCGILFVFTYYRLPGAKRDFIDQHLSFFTNPGIINSINTLIRACSKCFN